MNAIVIAPAPHLVVFGRDTSGKPHASWFDQPSAELATKAAGLMNMHAVPVEGDALRELAGSLPRGRVFSSGRAFTPFVAGKLYTRLVELTRDALGPSDGEPAAGDVSVAGEPGQAAVDAPAATEPVQAAEDAPAAEEPPAAAPKASPAKARPALQLVGGDKAGEPKVEAGAPPATPAAAQARSVARPSRVEDIGIGSLVLATTGPAEGWWEAEVIGTNGNMLTLRWRDFSEPTVVRRRTEVSFLQVFAG